MSAHHDTLVQQEAYVREMYFTARVHEGLLRRGYQEQHGLTLPQEQSPFAFERHVRIIPFTQCVGTLAGRMFGALQEWQKTAHPDYLARGLLFAQRFEEYCSLIDSSQAVARSELLPDPNHLFAHLNLATHPRRLCPGSVCETEHHLEFLRGLATQDQKKPYNASSSE
jgi:hypothetical protein